MVPKMPKMLYITNIYEDKSDGIWNKIKYNVLAYQRLGIDVDFAYRKEDGYYVIENKPYTENRKFEVIECIYKDFFYYNLSLKINCEYDLVYIRKPVGGASFIFLKALLKKLKNNKRCKIVFEIPTFPYEKEINTARLKISDLILKCCLPFTCKYIDVITYMGDKYERIWGVPTLRIANGIDLNFINVVRTELKPLNDEFIFVGVARLSFWHGYDRLIKAIYNYKGKYTLKFIIVGSGEPEMSALQENVRQYGIQDNILFTGSKSGNELDAIYEQAHVCVDSLGRHRSGSFYNSSLKSKEYTAKGLPFIKSHMDDSFMNVDFIFDVTPDEKDIDVKEIIQWYSSLSLDTPARMRHFADNNLSWDIQCKKILNELKIK